MSTKTWRVTPLHTMVMEALNRKKAMTDTELFEFLKGRNESLSFKELNKILMKLEIAGSIKVASLTKGKRHVELTEK